VNVCRVSRAFFPVIDGAAQHVWGLSRAQAGRGHVVWLLQPHVDAMPDTPPGLLVRRVPTGPLYAGLYRSKAALAAFAATAAVTILARRRAMRPDVIHAHGDAIEAACLAFAARRLRVPLVLTIHGGLTARPRYRRWAPVLFRGVDRFIVVAPSVREQLLALGVAAGRVSVISSGVDLSRFRRAAAERPAGGGARVIAVGRLHPVKGFEYLIRAMRRLEDAGRKASLAIVGDGPERGRLAAEAAGLSSVELLGEQPPERVAALLAEAQIFALPSVDIGTQSEGTPTAAIEAMAAGLPVVCTASGGLGDLVQDGVSGLVVPPRDAVALAGAIARLADDAALRQAMGERNRALARSRDWSVVAGAVDDVYRAALGSRAA